MTGPEAILPAALAAPEVTSLDATPTLAPSHPRSIPFLGRAERLRTWLGIFSAYFSTQGAVQLLGIAAGLVLIRVLPLREFALYTLATSAVTFFTFASDLGSTTSLVHFFRRAREEGRDFAAYLAAVLSLRRMAFLLGAAAVLLVFPRAARAKGFGAAETWCAAAGVVLTVLFQISSSVRILALRLADRYGRSYRAELAGAGVRLLAVLAMVAAGALFGWLGVFTGAAAAATVVLLAQPESGGRPASDAAGPRAAIDLATPARLDAQTLAPYRREVLRYLAPTLPGAVYFAVQGPLVVWLAAVFGSGRNIAEVGALSRLALVVGLFSGLTGVVFLPRLARIADERLYRRRALQFGGLLAAVALTLVAAAAVAPRAFLFLLGGRYYGLDRELVLLVASSGLTLLDGYAVAVNLARSWTRWQGLAAAGLAAVQVLLAMMLPLSSTAGVLTFQLLSAATALAGQVAILALGFARPAWVSWR
jgi:O-antigen/teichoic acid export membrane protein